MSRQKSLMTYVVPFVAGLFLVLALLVLVNADRAYGHRVYQGNDMSKTVNNDFGLTVCDRERDGNKVRGDARSVLSGSASVYDNNGAYNGCNSKTYNVKLVSHRTCESRGWRWACSSFYREP